MSHLLTRAFILEQLVRLFPLTLTQESVTSVPPCRAQILHVDKAKIAQNRGESMQCVLSDAKHSIPAKFTQIAIQKFIKE